MPAFTCWLDWLYSQWVAICLGLQSGPIEFIARKKFIKTVQQEKSLVQQGNLCAHFCCSTPPFRDLGFYPCGETTGRYSPNLMEFPKDLGWASLPLALSVSHLGNGKSKAWDRGLDQWLGCSLLLSQWKAMAFGQWPEWQSSMSKLWRNECNVWWATAYSCFTDLSTEMQQWYNGTMEFQKTFSLTSVPLLLLLYLLMSWIFLRGVLILSWWSVFERWLQEVIPRTWPGQQSSEAGSCLVRNQEFLCTALNLVLMGFRNSETSYHCYPLYRAARHLLTRGFLFHLQLCPALCKSAPTKFCVSSPTSPQGF